MRSGIAEFASLIHVAKRSCAAVSVSLVCLFGISQAAAQIACPASDADVNYNCPIGPLYVLPSWGNVPWSDSLNWTSIETGDLDGDGFEEIVGRDATGVHLYAFSASQGIWLPVLTTDGSKELVLPLTDAAGYGVPAYRYKLVDLSGSGVKQLVVRAPTGLAVYKLVSGPPTIDGLKTASWTSVATGGPFADSACFSNGLCWNSEPYFDTVRYGDIDGDGGAEAIGWGGNGIVAWKWTGTGWTQLASPTTVGGDVRNQARSVIPTMQFAKLSANAGQKLMYFDNGSTQGVVALTFTPGVNGGSWAPFPNSGSFAFATPDCSIFESCWGTFRAADLDGNGIDSIVIRETFCVPKLIGGMIVANVNQTTQQWQLRTSYGPFSDCDSGTSPASVAYSPSIQFAHLSGKTVPEILGRLPGGINVYQWNGSGWNTLTTNVPQLSDPTWAADPSFYRTIRTAKLPGSSVDSLLARGQNGIRTWSYANNTFSRPLPYGGYPAFTGAQATAYTAIQTLLALASPVRDTYTDPMIDNSATSLRSYMSSIALTCSGPTSGSPPQYATCTPQHTATNPAYTTVANQLIKELWLAAFVVDHFTTLQTMQNSMFLDDSAVLPTIGTDLKLPAAASKVGLANYLSLFSSILKLLGPISPALTQAGNAVATVSSSLGFFANPASTSFQQSYDEMQSQVTTLIGAMQNANLAQKHHILGDYVLLNNIGRFVASQLWIFDEAGYLSANRQAFALWVYQSLLPTLWQTWDVTNCGSFPADDVDCSVPPQTANFTNYQNPPGRAGSFTAVLPSQTPCQTRCYYPAQCDTTCSFAAADPGIVTTVFTPVSNACTYNAATANAWNYSSGSGACTLGVGQEIFNNTGGWKLAVNDIDGKNPPGSIGAASAASGLNDAQSPPVVRLQILTPITVDVDLRTAQLKITRLMSEELGADELVKAPTGADFGAVLLLPTVTTGAAAGRFETVGTTTPRVSAVVQVKPRRALNFDLSVDQAAIIDPQICIGAPEKTRLNFSMELSGGGLAQPLVFEQASDWECVRDTQGVIRMLRSTGNPAKSLGFVP